MTDDNWLNDCLKPILPYSVRRRRNIRWAIWLAVAAVAAIACGYFGAPYVGMGAVVLSDALTR